MFIVLFAFLVMAPLIFLGILTIRVKKPPTKQQHYQKPVDDREPGWISAVVRCGGYLFRKPRCCTVN